MRIIFWSALLSLVIACNSEKMVENEAVVSSDFAVGERLPSANIYEVNIRQYTPEGTFSAFSEHLPRLREMGVDILWFMPIFPISEKKRKGPMGSYYSVSDFREVNPEFGTLDEFRDLVKRMHDMGFIVILDWVPNHTGWDHRWITEHPEWYTQDPETDTIIHPEGTDWYDVADLNYDSPGLRKAMIEDLLFWIKEIDIDGYRMDVAYEVPIDFWAEAGPALKASKDIFMLAESASPEHRNSGYFHATYGWDMMHVMNSIAKGDKPISKFWDAYENDKSKYTKGWHMCFTTNHDENSWNGTVFERYGDKHLSYAVLAFTLQGMPLIYSGQEAGLDKALRFFEKDTIDWSSIKYEEFYSTLLQLKHENTALFNGKYGGEAQRLESSENVIAYYREKDNNRVVVAINLGDETGNWSPDGLIEGMTETFSGMEAPMSENIELRGGEYQIWTK